MCQITTSLIYVYIHEDIRQQMFLDSQATFQSHIIKLFSAFKDASAMCSL